MNTSMTMTRRFHGNNQSIAQTRGGEKRGERGEAKRGEKVNELNDKIFALVFGTLVFD